MVVPVSIPLTAAWTPKRLHDVQLDASAYVGLNRRTPDLELVVVWPTGSRVWGF